MERPSSFYLTMQRSVLWLPSYDRFRIYAFLYSRAQLWRKPAVLAAIQRLEEEQGDREGAAQKQNSSGAQVTANSGSFEHDDEDGNDTGRFISNAKRGYRGTDRVCVCI